MCFVFRPCFAISIYVSVVFTIPVTTNILEANQQECQIGQSHWKCWRTYSLNYDREHGGDHGEPWRRMFMSDGATAFAALALLPAD